MTYVSELWAEWEVVKCNAVEGWVAERNLYPQKKNKEVVSTPWEATRREYGGLAVHKELLRTAEVFAERHETRKTE